MAVDTVHPLYTFNKPTWERNTDARAGEAAIKRRTTRYLPVPNPDESPDPNGPRYQSYLTRAVFTNFTGRTVRALTGAVFRLPPTVELPTQIEYMRADADNNRLSLATVAQRAVSEVMTNGRYIVMADYPEAPTNATAEQTAGLRAYLAVYSATQLINWHESNGQLDLAVLREVREEPHPDGFDFDAVVYYRELRMIEGRAYIRLWRETMPVSEYVELRAGGQPLDELPLVIIGSDDNDPTPDAPPISDIAALNIAHYRNSADTEEGAFICGQPMLHINTGETSADAFASVNGTIQFGSRNAVTTQGGSMDLVQMEPNSASLELQRHKEEQMVRLGAQIISDARNQETAEGARIRSGAETSVLNTVVRNVSEAFEQCLRWCAMYEGGNADAVEFRLNERFFSENADPQLLAQLWLGVDRGAYTVDVPRDYLRKSGSIPSDKTNEDLDAEVSNSSPLL